jgi:putative nucleotidyltransferase with HDIG domain
MPVLLHELTKELAKEECSLVRVGELVSQDVAMTAKILRLVNSAYFGLRFEVSNADTAVRYLGINTISTLVMICHIFQHADRTLTSWMDLNHMWRHSLTTSQWARKIAEKETGDRKLVDDSLGAGMLHDAGRLVLAMNFPDTYRGLIETANAGEMNLVELERSMLGVTHAEIGAYLMRTWGLCDEAVEAIAYHHNPLDCVNRRFSPLTAVHTACALAKVGTVTPESIVRISVDEDYLSQIGFLDRLDTWRDLGSQMEDGELLEPR